MKNKIVAFILMFLAFAGFTGAATVSAQEPTVNDEPVIYNSLPSIFVTNLFLKEIKNNAVQGEFKIINESKDAFSDLNYTIYLIDPEKKNNKESFSFEEYSIFDEKKVSLTERFSAGESKPISFSYTAPSSLPLGEYRLRIRVGTSSGQQLGWDDSSLTIGSDSGYVRVVAQAIKAEGGQMIDGELNNKGEAMPLDGVNVNPGKKVSLYYSLNNIGTKDVTGNLVYSVYEWDNSGKAIATEKIKPVIIKPGTKNAISDGVFETTSQSKPGSYFTTLAITDEAGNKMSSVGEYRYVVTGKSGRIVTVSLKEVGSSKITASAEVVGPADRVTTIKDAHLKFSLLDNGTVVDEKLSGSLNLNTDNVVTATQSLEPKNAKGDLQLKLDLTDEEGKILHTYSVKVGKIQNETVATPGNINNTTKPNQSIWIIVGAIIIILVVSIVLFLLIVKTRHKVGNIGSKILALILFGFGVAALGFSTSQLVKAQGQATTFIPESAHHNVRLFINQPSRTELYQTHTIPVGIDIYWQHCKNRYSQGWVYGDYFAEGGHIVPKGDANTVPGGQREWWPEPAQSDFNIHGTDFIRRYIPANLPSTRWVKVIDNKWDKCKSCGSGYDNIQQRTFTGTITLPATMERATLRFIGFKKHFATGSGADQWDDWVNAAAYYSWIRFAVPLSCTITSPSPAPTSVAAGTPLTLTAAGGYSDQTYRWSSSNTADVFSPVTGTTTTLTPQAGSPTIKVMNSTHYLDVDGNGTVTMSDRDLVVNYLNGGRTPVPATGRLGQNQTNPLDVNGDGNVFPSDVVLFNATNTANYIIPVAVCGPNVTITQPLPQIKVMVGTAEHNSSTPIDFGNQEKNSTTTRTVTVTNVGDPNSTLVVDNSGTSISPAGAFSLPTALSIPALAQGQSATFSVSFTPLSVGPVSSNLRIASNDLNATRGSGTLTIGLRGAGIESPAVTLKFKKTDGTLVDSLVIAKDTNVTLHTEVTPADSICTATNTGSNVNWTGTKPSGVVDSNVGAVGVTTTFALNCHNPANPALSTQRSITATVQDSTSGTNIRDL